MKSLPLTLFIFSLLLIFFSNHSWAASPYSLKLENELLYLGAGAGLAVAGYYNERNRSTPTSSNIEQLDNSGIPFFDRGTAGKWNQKMGKLSDVMLVSGLLSPAPFIIYKKNDFLTLGIMYLETYALSGGGTAFAKGTFSRYRPYSYGNDAPLDEKLNQETKRSFFSGHTALATSGLVFTASVFSDYYPDSKYKSSVWAAALTGSVATGWLRVQAGRHFPSDVILGLIWGGSVGYFIPKLHKNGARFTLFPFFNGKQNGIAFQRIF